MILISQVLNLDFCTLTKLPASLGKLTALTTLDVEGNMYLGDDSHQESMLDISAQPQFPLQLAGLTALRYLNLNSCELSAVPEVYFCYLLLWHIDCSQVQAHAPEKGLLLALLDE